MIDGRIVKGIGGLYTVVTDEETYMCKARGIFRLDNITPLVGDYVKIIVFDEKDKEGAIEKILPRKVELIRPRVANVDLVALIFTIKNPNLNIDLLDRFLVLAEEVGLEILICINKIDLIDEEELNELKSIYKKVGYDVVGLTTFDKNSYKTIENYFRNKVSVFAGPSGVGKSSIINMFIEDEMEVGELSRKTQRGKHTTRHAELIKIHKNTFVVDSPGFTSVSLTHIKKEDLQYYFKEFIPLLGTCKFSNCAHNNEPGCSIKKSIGNDVLQSRYDRYIYFYNELEEVNEYD